MSENDPKEPEYQYPDLTDHSDHSLSVRNALSLDRMDHNLNRIAQSLQTLVAEARSTTPQQAGSAASTEVPPAELPAEASPTELTLPDGRKVPTKVVRALAEYDEATWPGALDPRARASVASVVLGVVQGDTPPPLSTNYPFCLDDPENVSNDSPCIKRVEHPGKHQDNNDGTW